MNIGELSDSELIGRISKKDYEAFNEFWIRYDRFAMFLFQRLFRDKFLAQDAYQQLFTVIWEKSCNYRGGNAKAYVQGIAKNIARKIYIGEARKNAVEVPYSFLEEEDNKIDKIMFKSIAHEGKHNAAYDNLLLEEVIEKIQAFRNNLPEKKSRLFSLRMDGLHWKEISEKLKVPEGTCSNIYRRLCTKIKYALKEYKIQ